MRLWGWSQERRLHVLLGAVYKKASVCGEKNVAKEEGPQSQAEKDCKMGDSIPVKTAPLRAA